MGRPHRERTKSELQRKHLLTTRRKEAFLALNWASAKFKGQPEKIEPYFQYYKQALALEQMAFHKQG